MTIRDRGNWRRRAAAVAVGAIGLAGGAVAMATPASAATIIGGIDVGQQCSVQTWRPLEARLLDPNNAYSWRCYSKWTQNYYGVDMDGACRNQYGAGAFSVVLDPNNAYSWRCAR
ncbi:hypothetical protein F0L68_36670 [Solihabitans fulvus]|uniref:Uncharacterized protein n=1 Tax=Solihabitans fulvus TaxID=1892852 RepID=A0A5B2WMT9_9PSEU|nr:hypothetical protein [Solihabitans fulvus]KAA2252268.1 hypothetical protein F0L68_36670 [Solihabitans fulvus]